jgi:hypothetical protein
MQRARKAKSANIIVCIFVRECMQPHGEQQQPRTTPRMPLLANAGGAAGASLLGSFFLTFNAQ